MNAWLILAFAGIAAAGNALFALGQKQATGAPGGLVYVGLCALVACLLAFACAPLVGPVWAGTLLRGYWRPMLLSGSGLFLTYVGFHLLYTRFGTSPYVVYAALAIITTTVGVGLLYLREPFNGYHATAIALALAAIVFFWIGQTRL